MSVCAVSCQVGPEQGSHRHKGPNGVTKDVQEAPLRLGEPQRGSPLPCQPAGTLTTRARERWQQSHVLPAGMHGTPTLMFTHKQTHTHTCICRNARIYRPDPPCAAVSPLSKPALCFFSNHFLCVYICTYPSLSVFYLTWSHGVIFAVAHEVMKRG